MRVLLSGWLGKVVQVGSRQSEDGEGEGGYGNDLRVGEAGW